MENFVPRKNFAILPYSIVSIERALSFAITTLVSVYVKERRGNRLNHDPNPFEATTNLDKHNFCFRLTFHRAQMYACGCLCPRANFDIACLAKTCNENALMAFHVLFNEPTKLNSIFIFGCNSFYFPIFFPPANCGWLEINFSSETSDTTEERFASHSIIVIS